MLELKNITFRIPSSNAYLFKGLNLSVQQGEFIFVLGENGVGKSTLFKIISGEIFPSSGKIYAQGTDITKLKRYKRSNCISFVAQDPNKSTVAEMTILENMFLAYRRGQCRRFQLYNTGAAKQAVNAALTKLNMGLENKLNHIVGGLSGGQKQALAVAMANLQGDGILLFDEITAALDKRNEAKIITLANDIIRHNGRTAMMITHNIEHAIEYGDRIIILGDHGIKHILDKKNDSIQEIRQHIYDLFGIK